MPPQKYYAVQVGRTTGVYSSWSQVQAATSGYSGAVYKSFSSPAEAQSFASSSGGYSAAASSRGSGGGSSCFSSTSLSSTGLFSSYGGSGGSYSSATTHVYTDGSSRGNGQTGAKAGYGVYYGDGDSRNVSERLSLSSAQTNQRAELTAINHALRTAATSGESKDIHIHTDSRYSKSALTEWGDKWEQTGYKGSSGKTVTNKDLVMEGRHLMRQVKDQGGSVKISHVKAHNTNHGNNMADELAVKGANK